MKIVFATNNKHKVAEIQKAVGDTVQVVTLAEMNITEEIPEDQDTLQGNALQKAHYIKEHYGFDCFADDTGLEIAALDGRPGVYSARYAGPNCSPDDNMNKVLAEMEGVTNRAARFRTVIALILNGEEHLFEGEVDGEILTERHGAEGFGYDPIFRPDGYTESFAQMPMDLKNSISHRGRATAKFIAFLQNR
ncbi:MAG: non-canonical purine NTP diphosphatase [Marinifilaceae bacterium]